MEGAAQLRALQKAGEEGVELVPVWNKSNREHVIVGTSPDDVRVEADAAVKACSWRHSYYVDADHIGLTTVDRFLQSSDFYTIDVADYIGKLPSESSTGAFLKKMAPFKGTLHIPGVEADFTVTDVLLREIAGKYLYAIEEAGRVYRHIAGKKGEFVPEVSIDEAARPQTPIDMFFVLAAIAGEKIPVQTIAPKFTGSFLKGIDYVGDIGQFTREFSDNLSVVEFAVRTFALPGNLKLSVHSGSDKFSLYQIMHRAIKKQNAGLHLKTAGTTWLEEVIGLAASGSDGLRLAKEVYAQAFKRYDELCAPYLTVVNIDRNKLPQPREVDAWSAEEYVGTLRHNQSCDRYSVHFRQLIHVAYKVAAEMGGRYKGLLKECRSVIEENVTTNIFDRHIKPLFLCQASDGHISNMLKKMPSVTPM
jgi:hypothetical protein